MELSRKRTRTEAWVLTQTADGRVPRPPCRHGDLSVSSATSMQHPKAEEYRNTGTGTYLNSWWLENSYPNVIVEVEGTFRQHLFTLADDGNSPSKKSLLDQSFIPCQCREYNTEKEWYEVELTTLSTFKERYELKGHPPQLQTPEYDRVRTLLEERFADLTLRKKRWVHMGKIEKTESSKSSTPQDQIQWSDFVHVCEYVPYAFLEDMENTAGRMAVFYLLGWLSRDLAYKSDELTGAVIVGEESPKCPHKRLIKAYAKEGDAQLLNPLYPHGGMGTPSHTDVESDPFRVMTFVPDVVLETIQRWGLGPTRHKWLLLTCSVKSGHGLNEPAKFQLQYEMLPVVIEQKLALGLIICSDEAVLVKMEVDREKNQISHSYLNYDFIQADAKSFNFKNFDKMCRDIIYYCQVLYNTVSGANQRD